MKTKDWLVLAKEDSISGTPELKELCDILSSGLPNGEINNADKHLIDVYKNLYEIARKKQQNGCYVMGTKEILDESISYLDIKASFEKSFKDISFEDLL